MIIGVPKEIKADENRIAVVPAGVDALVSDGHTVLVEQGAGEGSGFADEEFTASGAKLVSVEEVWGAHMIIKVKEPLPAEYPRIRADHLLFTYFHFASSEQLTKAMLESKAACFAYETYEIGGKLPLLTPMSEVAGRMSVQIGAYFLERAKGGRGVLLGGVPGVEPGHVVILGGGIVGTSAAWMAAGLGANVIIMDINLDRLRYLDDVMPANVSTLHSNPYTVHAKLKVADLVVGAVLVEGAKAPTLVPKKWLRDMKQGAVIVDVAIDQGGCVESIAEHGPTTHSDPTFVVDDVLHYCVANMPGAVPRTSTYALTNATLPVARQIARTPMPDMVRDPTLCSALNAWQGHVTHRGVAAAFDLPYRHATELL
jgi:alanine dehydrogenase